MERHHSWSHVLPLSVWHGLSDVQGRVLKLAVNLCERFGMTSSGVLQSRIYAAAFAGKQVVASIIQVSDNPVHHIWGAAIFCFGLIFCFGPLGFAELSPLHRYAQVQYISRFPMNLHAAEILICNFTHSLSKTNTPGAKSFCAHGLQLAFVFGKQALCMIEA